MAGTGRLLLLVLAVLLVGAGAVGGSLLPRAQLLPFGAPSGDQALPDGDDESSEALSLAGPLPFYETRFSQLYVKSGPQWESFPTPRTSLRGDPMHAGLLHFPTTILLPSASFLADIDTSFGRGKIYYRQDESQEVLEQARQTKPILGWSFRVPMGFPLLQMTHAHTTGVGESFKFSTVLERNLLQKLVEWGWGKGAEDHGSSFASGLACDYFSPLRQENWDSDAFPFTGKKHERSRMNVLLARVPIKLQLSMPALSEGLSGQPPFLLFQRNTFQAVLAYTDSDAYAVFLYPEDGIQFFGTRPKESYNVNLELPARVGFSRGDFQRREGPYYSATSSEQSVKSLYQTSNSGIPGVWVFHIGRTSQLTNVIPASVGQRPSTFEGRLLRPSESSVANQNVLEAEYPPANLDYAESFYNGNEDDFEYLPIQPTEAGLNADLANQLQSRLPPTSTSMAAQAFRGQARFGTGFLVAGPAPHPPASVPEVDSVLLDPELPSLASSASEGILSLPTVYESPIEAVTAVLLFDPDRQDSPAQPEEEGGISLERETLPVYPDGEVVHESFPDNAPPFNHRRRVVGVDEDTSFNPDVFTYSAANVESCERHHGQCSQHAFCTDYSTGFCCHCQAKFYGNGRHCLPEGASHRLNGKVSGNLLVGQTPVRFSDVDLHAYIVGNDGRAYTAISHIPQPAARALIPLAPIGGLFGWLFALEKPGYENGFSITGAQFTHNFEATFYPGEEKVFVQQTAEGVDAENYLSIKMDIQGQLPSVPEDSTVHITPYKEIYHYSDSAVTSTSFRQYSLTSASLNQTLSYRLLQNITYWACPHVRHHRMVPAAQQLMVDRIFALYNEEERVLRYAITNQIGSPSQDTSGPTLVNPCYDGTHSCDTTARCQAGPSLDYTCECTTGYYGDGKECTDINECAEGISRCSRESVCVNTAGSYRCECPSGFQLAADRVSCLATVPPSNPCAEGTHSCASADRARCVYHGDRAFSCECLEGYAGNGRSCTDVDECAEGRCHPAAECSNSPGSFSCRCRAGYEGDGFQCSPVTVQRMTRCEHERLYSTQRGSPHPGGPHVPQCDDRGNYRPLQCHSSTGECWCVDGDGREITGSRTPPGSSPPPCGAPEPTQRPQTMCERWRLSLLEHYGGSPRDDQYVPQCDALGQFSPLQCHGNSGYCWCVDEKGHEVQGTRSEPGVPPPCLPGVAPPTARPSPRPDVVPPSAGTFLLYAQGQQIGYLPLNGTSLNKQDAKTLLSLHGSIVVGIDFDCREKTLYWTDVAGRTINRASLEQGAEPETVISTGLLSPEGLTVDHLRRTMFWTDSGLDKIESARLDGSERRVLFATDLVNPRAIAVDPIRGNLYWTDWNREAPKIETSTVTGEHRRILVNKDIGLPNGLTFDPFSKLICWADAGTKKLECAQPDGAGRHTIQTNLNYPFSLVGYADHFYHTDWRRDGVIAVNKDNGAFTGEYLPEQRTHLYGITAVHPYCPGGRK
ncbi:LOW QUALITY PROTEIN: nidogen-2 [Sphaerodactylus townsendi]|uniref:LOW QUALITY PROTEIN: nidogen-2 n=1 Tax=Sphaerodactylus townsendi TaxID=933632 RepID=UPI0020263206|nr:LOW QUALITY PROTEIN: nidogen-2 [Sphaerodactylus townsendi]